MKRIFRIYLGIVAFLMFVDLIFIIGNWITIEQYANLTIIHFAGIAFLVTLRYALTGNWPWDNEEGK